MYFPEKRIMTPLGKDMIAFAAIDGIKKKPEPRLKGNGG